MALLLENSRRGHIGNRGLGMYGSWLFFVTPDDYLVSLDAATGKERWHKMIADVKVGYFLTTAPVVIRNHVIFGTSSDEDVPGWVESRDAETGELQWKWYSTPRAGEPGSETWPDTYAREHGGGQPWVPETYDPELNLLYVPTGNPNPVMIGDARKGANLCDRIDRGTQSRHRKNGVVFPVLASRHSRLGRDASAGVVRRNCRRQAAQARRAGQPQRHVLRSRPHQRPAILSVQYAESPNWSKGFAPTGEPIPDPRKEPQFGGALVSPSNGGIANWAPPRLVPTRGFST